MNKHKNVIIVALDDVKKHVTIDKYPSSKTAIIRFALPTYINGVVTERYLILKHEMTPGEAQFIMHNLTTCDYIQPALGHVIIGSPIQDEVYLDVKTSMYGTFRIHGKRKAHCVDSKDIHSTLTSYVCAYGITAFVHTHKVNKRYVKSVYYGNKFDGLLKYIQLVTSAELYRAYIAVNNETDFTFKNGDYHESYRSHG